MHTHGQQIMIADNQSIRISVTTCFNYILLNFIDITFFYWQILFWWVKETNKTTTFVAHFFVIQFYID